MTITIEKKHLYALIGGVVCILVAYICFKSCGKPNYEANAKEMKLNTMAACYMAADVLSDYQKSWSSAIDNRNVKNADGEWKRPYDFNEAIKWRYQYYYKNGEIAKLDSLVSVVTSLMQIMDNPPSKYEKAQESFLSMYNDMNTLVSLVKDPKGNLISFGAKINELMMSVESKFKETDLKISVPIDSVTSRIKYIHRFEIAAALSKKAEEIKQKEELKEKSLLNSEKLKTEGYTELPNGKGILYKVIKLGKGKKAHDNSFVSVKYTNRLVDGTVTEDSKSSGMPQKFSVNAVVKGWALTLTNMHEGDRWEVFIPYDLWSNTTDMVCDIELVKVY